MTRLGLSALRKKTWRRQGKDVSTNSLVELEELPMEKFDKNRRKSWQQLLLMLDKYVYIWYPFYWLSGNVRRKVKELCRNPEWNSVNNKVYTCMITGTNKSINILDAIISLIDS